MNNLSISEMFRYLFSGVFAFFLLFISDKKIATDFLREIGGVANGILIFLVVGGLFYAIYKAIIYPLIAKLQDSRNRNCYNFRTYLKKKYSLSKDEALKLYSLILVEGSEEHNKDKEHRNLLASQIHFLYMSSLLLVLFSFWRFFWFGDYIKSLIFIVFSGITFISGLKLDIFFDESEVGLIKKIIKKSGPDRINDLKKFITCKKQ